MSKTIDFIQTNLVNLVNILRPPIKTDLKQDKKTTSSRSFEIKSSFQPETKSSINPHLQPQLRKLKQQLLKDNEKDKKRHAQFAQGKITRQQFINKTSQIKPKKQDDEIKPQDQVVVDASGQVRDKHGNIMFVKNEARQLLFNKNQNAEKQVKDLINNQKVGQTKKLARNLLDRNLIVGSSRRRVRRSMLGLQFLEKGSYQTSQNRAQIKNQVQDLNDVFAQQNQNQVKVIKKRKKVNLQFNRDVPDVQWWDQPLLSGKKYQQLLNLAQQTPIEDKIAHLTDINWIDQLNLSQLDTEITYQKVGIEDQNNRIVLPMYLTKQQKKKAKRKRKHQKLLQKNDQIKLGLIQADKPKLRVGNMAIVMKNQFVIDPSKVQAQARKQTEERVNKHLEANSARKLNKVQKKDKIIRKLKRDSAKECRRAVFKLQRLLQKTHDFKVNMNAKQLALNGFVIKPSNEASHFPTMVLVEGGARAIKLYKNLMLRRIHWSQSQPPNSCKLIWEGQIDNSTSGKWRVHQVSDQVEGLRLLTQKKLQNFWQYMTNE